jgi:hypothetical protein
MTASDKHRYVLSISQELLHMTNQRQAQQQQPLHQNDTRAVTAPLQSNPPFPSPQKQAFYQASAPPRNTNEESREPDLTATRNGGLFHDDSHDTRSEEAPIGSDTMSHPIKPEVPAGWEVIWNSQDNECIYTNIYTKESRWDIPTAPAVPVLDFDTVALDIPVLWQRSDERPFVCPEPQCGESFMETSDLKYVS